MSAYDFANVLFAEPCNLRCPTCIGRQVDPALNRDNWDDRRCVFAGAGHSRMMHQLLVALLVL
jgi:hypothetical protein